MPARSLQQVGTSEVTERQRYQYAHVTLLEYAQKDRYLGDPRFRDAIHRWVRNWADVGWPFIADDPAASVPQYLLANYPSTLAQDPQRLTALVSDIGWVEAAIRSVGVDHVLADLRQAAAADPASATVAAMLATVLCQAHHLRAPQLVSQPGYVLRQLCLQAAELGNERLAADARTRLLTLADPGPVPLWTTRRSGRALSAELGSHDGGVLAIAVLPGGRVVTGGLDGRVRIWDPAIHPASDPLELGSHDGSVGGVAVLPDERVVTGGIDGRVRVWDPAAAGAGPLERGRHDGPVAAVAVLPDGRVVTGGTDGRVLIWDLAIHPAWGPQQLGHHDGGVQAVAVLPDGRVVTGGSDGRVRLWDPAASGAAPPELGGYDGPVGAVAVLPDGQVVTGGIDGRVRVWDPAAPGAGWRPATSVDSDHTRITGHRRNPDGDEVPEVRRRL